MKFSTALSAFVLALPLLAVATPSSNDLDARQFGRQRGGGKGGNKKGGNAAKGGNNKGGNAAAASAAAAAAAASAAAGKGAAAAATSAAAAASTSVAATGIAQNAGKASKDAQTSTTLDPTQIMPGVAQDGQAVQEAGQVPSITSTNNFINFCLTRPDLPLMNGQQVLNGACNPIPMGVIVAKAKMPSVKFKNPVNMQTIATNTPFTIQLAVNNLISGNFVNPNTNYFSAPAQTDKNGLIIGHDHVVVEKIASLADTSVPDPTKFAFFKGMNAAAVGGVLTADVTAGLAAGTYRVCSITTAANHQPVLAVVAQHGSFEDCAFFNVADGGGKGAGAGGQQAAGAASATAAAAASTDAAASGKAAAAGGAAGGNAAAAAKGKGGGKKGGKKGGKGGKRGRGGRGRGRRALSSRND